MWPSALNGRGAKSKAEDSRKHANRGLALYHRHELDRAIAEFRKAIELVPDNADPHNDLGVALDEKGENDAALAEFREALRLDPGHARAHCYLGAA